MAQRAAKACVWPQARVDLSRHRRCSRCHARIDKRSSRHGNRRSERNFAKTSSVARSVNHPRVGTRRDAAATPMGAVASDNENSITNLHRARLRFATSETIINQLTAHVAFRRDAATAPCADCCPTPGIRFQGYPLFLKDPPGVGFFLPRHHARAALPLR